jgi:uroporphyrin-III C-methyltransferase
MSPSLPSLAAGQVWLVGAGPGDPGLMTLMGQSALEQADIILHDALVPEAILALAGPAARLEAVGKRKGRPSTVQMRINARLVRLARQGLRVVRLKGGDPFVFGRGGEEALALKAAGVPFRIVPGVSAGTAAPALMGIPVTHRGLARSVAFVTGHGMGGDEPRDLDLEALARGAETLVLFMAATRMASIAARLLAAGRPATEPVAFVIAAGTPAQQRLVTSLGEAAAAADALPPGPPVLIVVGPVAGLAEILAPEIPAPAASPLSTAPRLAS